MDFPRESVLIPIRLIHGSKRDQKNPAISCKTFLELISLNRSYRGLLPMIIFCSEHEHLATREDIHRLENLLRQIETQILMKVSQEAAVLNAALAQVKKGLAEIVAKIAALQAAVDNQDEELPAEVTSALADLTTTAQAIDDIVPDVTDVTDLGGTSGTTLRS